MFDIESSGASPSGETAGLVTGKESVKGLVAGLEPSAELLAIAMGGCSPCMPPGIAVPCSMQPRMGRVKADSPLAAQCTSFKASWVCPG